MTKVVNLYQTRQYDVYIGRSGRGEDGYFGNPFVIDKENSRETVLEKYKKYFDKKIENDPVFLKNVFGLKNKILGCFCKPQACHGDIIAEWLDKNNESST